ncbi:hypothetical protein L916_02536 [Phytophthora nicotianae]|uniref:Acetyl-CoA carboxylase central domain-containing protein n=1 Tax=Phytophthora nicotianae TaxID=4792 RepID=W2JQ68_PHYNI|nr:hypothetical protein L916_02536 [Phytophthora nicotianae]
MTKRPWTSRCPSRSRATRRSLRTLSVTAHQERVHGRDNVVPACEEVVVGAQRPSCQCASRDSGERALGEGEPAGTGRDVPRVSGPEPPPAQHPPRDLFGAPVEHREYLDHNADMALYPNIYTFPGRLNYSEDKIVRRMEAPIAYKLELRRLQTYNVKEWIASRVANLRQEDGVLKVPNTLQIMHHLDGK